MILTALASIFALDAAGYHFTARRLTYGGGSTLVLLGGCWGSIAC